MSDRSIGSLHLSTPALLADKLAWAIMGYRSPRAVTLDPEGRVWLERVEDAAESDLIGVYNRSLGVLELTRTLLGDLRQAKTELGARVIRERHLGQEATAKRRRAA